MTQENLLDAVVADLSELFNRYKLVNSLDFERTVRVFANNLPIREGDDEATDLEAPPEPYILAKIPNGELPGNGEMQTVSVVLLICVQDPDPNRQGYRDALHIINEIILHYGSCDIVGGRYQVIYPVSWAMQEEDTHPHYFAAVAVKFETAAIFKEVPET